MPKIKPLPWEKWDMALNEFGEWILLASIGCASLPAPLGLLLLFMSIVFFLLKMDKRRVGEIDRFNELRKKRDNKQINATEAYELSTYEAALVITPPKRDSRLYWLGTAVFLLVLIYQSIRFFGFMPHR